MRSARKSKPAKRRSTGRKIKKSRKSSQKKTTPKRTSKPAHLKKSKQNSRPKSASQDVIIQDIVFASAAQVIQSYYEMTKNYYQLFNPFYKNKAVIAA